MNRLVAGFVAAALVLASGGAGIAMAHGPDTDPGRASAGANATATGDSPLEWKPTGGPRGGYSRFLVQDPTDDRVVYAAFHAAGVWKSTDGGETWERRSDGLGVLGEAAGIERIAVSALAMAESRPETLYVGNGLGEVYKSTDGAERWAQVWQTPDEGETGNPGPVHLIGVSPHDPALVFVGTNGGSFYVSRDGGDTWATADDGMDIKGTATGSIAFDPVDEAVVYFGSSFFDIEAEGRGSGLYKSTDAGRTWRPIGDGLESDLVNAIAVDPVDPSHLMVATGSTFSWGFDTHGVYESTDAGETFEPVGPEFRPFTHAVPYVAFSRHDDRVLVGNHPSLDAGVFRSDDGGQSWTALPGLWGDFVTDIVEFDDPNRLLATLYWSGLWLSEDGGASWRPVGEVPTSVLHSVHAPGFDADRVYAAAHSNGLFYSDDRGTTWNRVPEGDGGVIHESIIHNYGSSSSRFSPNLLWIRGEFSNEVVVVRDVTAPEWGSIPVPGRMTSILAHPTEPGRAYVGSDRGLFTATYPDLELQPTVDFPGDSVTDLDTDGTTVVVGTGDGVFASSNGGRTWDHLGLGGAYVTAVTVSGSIVYAAVDGAGVYRAAGGTFKRVNGLDQVTQLLVDPGDAEVVYFAAAGPDGSPAVYSSSDGGRTVAMEAADLPTRPTTEPHRLAFSADGTTLYLASADRGVWTARVRDAPLPVPEPVATPRPTEPAPVPTSTPMAASSAATPEPPPSRTATTTADEASDGSPEETTVTVSTPGFGQTLPVLALLVLTGIAMLGRRGGWPPFLP